MSETQNKVQLRSMGRKKEYIIDRETTNLSFLKTSLDLHRLGIEENDFFLRLYNPMLQGIDPHSPFLTREQKQAIVVECSINPWYFLREVSIIPDQGAGGIRFQLHRGNLAMIFLFLSGIDSYTVLPRQKGKTQSAIAILLWAFIFGTSNSEFMFLNKTQDDAINNLTRLKDQRKLLPDYMQSREFVEEDGKLNRGIENVKSVLNPVVNNKIVTKPKATSKETAKNLGRGNTQPRLGTMLAIA